MPKANGHHIKFVISLLNDCIGLSKNQYLMLPPASSGRRHQYWIFMRLFIFRFVDTANIGMIIQNTNFD